MALNSLLQTQWAEKIKTFPALIETMPKNTSTKRGLQGVVDDFQKLSDLEEEIKRIISKTTSQVTDEEIKLVVEAKILLDNLEERLIRRQKKEESDVT